MLLLMLVLLVVEVCGVLWLRLPWLLIVQKRNRGHFRGNCIAVPAAVAISSTSRPDATTTASANSQRSTSASSSSAAACSNVCV